MKVDYNHKFEQDEARNRIQAMIDHWVKKYGISATWSDYRVSLRGKVMGVNFDGDIDVGDSRISGDVKAGFLAERLGARQYVETKLAEYLNPSVSLDKLKS